MYSEIKPSFDLMKSVDTFWFLSNNKSSEKFKICPDACTDLIFDLNLNKVFLSGVMSTYQQIEVPANSNLIGVRFKSENFGSLLEAPLNEFKNLNLEIGESLPISGCNIINELEEIESMKANINKLEVFITTVLSNSQERRDELIISIANRIRQLKGNFAIKELANNYHISHRQLQRRFKQYIGLTIKEFSNIIRFKNTELNIRNNQETSLMEIAFNMGYYDHSHMNYEFNRIAGENPNNFR